MKILVYFGYDREFDNDIDAMFDSIELHKEDGGIYLSETEVIGYEKVCAKATYLSDDGIYMSKSGWVEYDEFDKYVETVRTKAEELDLKVYDGTVRNFFGMKLRIHGSLTADFTTTSNQYFEKLTDDDIKGVVYYTKIDTQFFGDFTAATFIKGKNMYVFEGMEVSDSPIFEDTAKKYGVTIKKVFGR